MVAGIEHISSLGNPSSILMVVCRELKVQILEFDLKLEEFNLKRGVVSEYVIDFDDCGLSFTGQARNYLNFCSYKMKTYVYMDAGTWDRNIYRPFSTLLKIQTLDWSNAWPYRDFGFFQSEPILVPAREGENFTIEVPHHDLIVEDASPGPVGNLFPHVEERIPKVELQTECGASQHETLVLRDRAQAVWLRTITASRPSHHLAAAVHDVAALEAGAVHGCFPRQSDD
ncbi:hypothetical protein SELMODRAFT_403153 [Selaginella moellendorffii]|uniref:Uncharacterized protein n=1 Tax=Selaginella moellendorffii TaxID=88036 RepID=D8QP78_SELML|nr:hypothetical protein SELMODRAFT_403153 [Selaginella moellendorffii]